MSTAQLNRTDFNQYSQLSFTGMLSSEWIKLRSLRSTIWTYLSIVIATLLIPTLIYLAISSSGFLAGSDSSSNVAAHIATSSFSITQLIVVVLGVLTIGGEYSTGMIKSTFVAVPKRTFAVIAKITILFITSFILTLVAGFIAMVLTTTMLNSQGYEFNPVSAINLESVFLFGLFNSLIAVVGFGIAAILKSTPGGLAVSLGLLLVMPGVLTIIPSSFTRTLSEYLPGALFNDSLDPNNGFSAVGASLIMLAWAVVLTTTATLLIKNRDV